MKTILAGVALLAALTTSAMAATFDIELSCRLDDLTPFRLALSEDKVLYISWDKPSTDKKTYYPYKTRISSGFVIGEQETAEKTVRVVWSGNLQRKDTPVDFRVTDNNTGARKTYLGRCYTN